MSAARRARPEKAGVRAALAGATRRTWAEIDLDAIAANVRALRALLAGGTRFMAVVKADGYGHGDVAVARAALQAGAEWLGVATVQEGLRLRRARIRAPVLVLGPAHPGEVGPAVGAGLSLTIASPEGLAPLLRAGRRARLHLKVDTGMTRLGVPPADVPAVLSQLALAGSHLEGVYTHLATADDPDQAFAREQLNRFESVLPAVRRRFPAAIVHAANSAAAIGTPRARYDLVRVGLAMYGLHPAPHLQDAVALQPAMRLLSRVVRAQRVPPGTAVSYGAAYRLLRASTIATVACGYADGYPRLAGLSGELVLNGERVPIAGRVCMDHLMVDAGDRAVRAGDEVELFGRTISADEVARWAQTIAYEVVCGVGPRVPRVYFRGGRPVAVRMG
ncbi:MAG: alanine racemase [Armatimonadota bacterium]|nr:alanine racemase [Armatimonadota bacterium]MDR7452604.1 alanine racemase [Armatimonadota bacterium]MDR7468235.1 alanine racemase [Armatimonadota bacterium]MDR7495229.1 alanine racemase [Armatimonadota bacterium]MDR7500476.1 alanine racemase [Armatimonadota bacterium]